MILVPVGPARPAWSPPVAAEPPPRYFLVGQHDRDWEELLCDARSDEFAEKLGDGRNLIEVHTVGIEKYRLVCSCYYADNLVCELTISQPLPRAMATFNALLEADSDAESGLLYEVTVR